MAGLAEAENYLAPRTFGKAAVVLGQPGPRRDRLIRRRSRGERSLAGQRGRDDRGREEKPLESQDAYTEIRCMELFM